jgi:CRP/FNR family cyclic AMP-dependent transcriptional regulator
MPLVDPARGANIPVMSPLSPADRRRFVGGTDLFRGCAPAELDRIAALLREKRYAAGQTIFQRGDEGSGMLFVVSGQVHIVVSSAEGREIILNIIEPGQEFGELALLDGEPRSADAVAHTDSVILSISHAEFMPLLARNPDISAAIMRVLCGRLRRTSTQLESVALLELGARLARLLLSLADTVGEATKTGTRIRLRLSQSELGQLVAGSRSKVNRHLMDWQASGVLARDGGCIVVRDRDALEDIAAALKD